MGGPHAYREHRPPPAWRHAVVCCWELRVGTSGAQRVLPDGCADLLIVDGGPLSVVGTADAVDLPVLERGALVRGIRLRPEIVGVLLGENAARLRNTTVQLDDVFGARRARDMRRPEALDRWLTEARPDERVARALRCHGS